MEEGAALVPLEEDEGLVGELITRARLVESDDAGMRGRGRCQRLASRKQSTAEKRN